MPPRHELNERFHAHIRRAQRVRVASTVFLASITLLAVVGSAALAFQDIAPRQFARATSHARNLPSNIASQLAAVSSLPWLDSVAGAIFRAVCPFVSDCESVAANSATYPPDVKHPLPSKAYSYQATTSPNAKLANPAPAAGGAPAPSLAPINRASTHILPIPSQWLNASAKSAR